MPQRISLLPGVRLTAVRSEKFKTSCLSISLLRPLRRGEAGLNALIPSILLRGCGPWPGMRELSRFLENAYGASVGSILRKRGEVQMIGLYAEFLDDALLPEPMLQTMISLLGSLLLDPVTVDGGFHPDYFAVERDNLLNAIDADANDKRVYAYRRLYREMFAGEAFATPAAGEKTDLEAVTPRSLYAYYRHVLVESPIEIFYLGSSDPEPVASAFRAILEPISSAERIQPTTASSFPLRQPRLFSETQPLEQSKLVIGFRMAVPRSVTELAAQQVFLMVYGAGSTSKLFLRMREEQSLCYNVSAAFDRRKGALFVYAGIDAAQYEPAVREIRAQLSACAEGEITDEELRLAKAQLLSQLRGIQDNPGRLEELYTSDSLGPFFSALPERIAAVEAVTREAAAAAARTVREDTAFFLRGAAE